MCHCRATDIFAGHSHHTDHDPAQYALGRAGLNRQRTVPKPRSVDVPLRLSDGARTLDLRELHVFTRCERGHEQVSGWLALHGPSSRPGPSLGLCPGAVGGLRSVALVSICICCIPRRSLRDSCTRFKGEEVQALRRSNEEAREIPRADHQTAKTIRLSRSREVC